MNMSTEPHAQTRASDVRSYGGDTMDGSTAGCPHHCRHSCVRKKIPETRRPPYRLWSSCHIVIPVLLQFLLTYAQGQGHGSVDVAEGLLPPVDERVEFEVEEERNVSTYVGTIPTLPGLTYRFSEEHSQFSLNPVTGELRTKVKLDREALSSDVFDLFVQSSPSARHLIEVRIVVLDVNDNSPVFGQPSIELTFSERDQPGTQAILDTATDNDIGTNDVTTEYQIISGNGDGRFRLVLLQDTSIPLLYLENTVELDREERQTYQLRISVPDGGTPPRYGYLLVNVSVRDYNDNHPVFDQSYYSVEMNETSPPGTKVIQVTATDQDIGPNGDITYSITSDDYDQFAVDPLTGIMTTTKILHCLQTCDILVSTSCQPNSCFVTIEARDRGGLSGRAYLTITLMDENDHNPMLTFRYFNQLPYATVDESAREDDIVAFVSVSDPDDDINGQTTVRITNGNQLGHFRLRTQNLQSNVLAVVGPIDRERVSKYNLTFEARDMGTPPRKSSAHLVIMINDINDHAPVFQRSSYHRKLSELVPVGSFVESITASDNDTGINADITYTIVSGNDYNWFHIDRKTGLVTTVSLLDHERTPRVVLRIQAEDGAMDSLSVRTNLTVIISDENDDIPTFDQSDYTVLLTEGVTAGIEVITVRAVDRDQGKNGSVIYSFMPDIDVLYPGLLQLNQITGQVSLARELDREEFAEVVITLQASDRGSSPLSSLATVTINVLDLNDNIPVFYPTMYYVSLGENLPRDTFVTQVTASDPDFAENGTVKYRFQEGTNMKFTINIRTGVISTQVALDREDRSTYQLVVTAVDSGGREAEVPAIVEVTVTDVLDNPPTFSQAEYSFSILEDDGRLGSSRSREVDSVRAATQDVSGVVRYVITGGDSERMFNIDENSGRISTTRHLDREHKAFYQLQITAISGQLFGVATANISVLDVNDHTPSFQNSVIEAYVVENWPIGHSVYLASAEDPDAGENGRLTYSLMPGSSPVFSVNEDTAMITLGESLQYVTDTSFDLTVQAQDHGIPPLRGTQSIHVSLTDVNDHTPQFEQASYEVSINEDQPVNDRFSLVIANDADHGDNGKVSYVIENGNTDGKFGVFPDGVLYIAQPVDREIKDIYILIIRAKDGGIDPRSSVANVTIRILDTNDNAPQFPNETYHLYLEEGHETGWMVGAVSASDRDTGLNAEISYAIEEPKGFRIGPKSGMIWSNEVFDRERLISETGLEEIVITVSASDAGQVSLSTTTEVHIHITDINDNRPLFQQPAYEASVMEDQGSGTPVIRVIASDEDKGPNAELSYSILQGNEDEAFLIDATSGQISLSTELDRETKQEYDLVVMAVDNGEPPLNSTVPLHISVQDVNDNNPEFLPVTDMTDGVVSILETAPVGDFVTQVQATDRDLGNNAFVTYRIVGGNTGLAFRIDANDGRIFVAAPLDFENRNLYTLRVMVEDAGEPSRSASVVLPVHVLDYNDNSPVFLAAPVIRQISEGSPVGTSVVMVTARDPDNGKNGQVRYQIQQQDPAGSHFRIDPETGLIDTNGEIDREFADSFVITVRAEDQAEPASMRKMSQKQVTVLILDVNDNAPVFLSVDAVPVMLGAQPDTLIMQVRVEDKDDGENAEVNYEIINGQTNLFRIDPVTGNLYLRASLSNQVLTYDLTIRATDRGFSDRLGAKSTISQLTVFTESSSEAGPQFTQTSYSGHVYENQPVDTSVATVRAMYTARPAAEVVYYLTEVRADGTDQDRLFQVNPTTGVVSTAGPLDREAGHGLFDVEVYAVDRSSNTPQTRKVRIQVTLLDLNDSPPEFQEPRYTFQVAEDVAAGYLVATLVATDADQEGSTTFNISEGGAGMFDIDPQTGSLRVVGDLDRERESLYKVKVTASDGQQSSEITVTLEVTDVNDAAPVFDQTYYYLDMAEDTPTGAMIGQVHATDPDEGDNAEITYSISSYWGREKFSVHHANGVFTLAGDLDYEEIHHYVLTVKAQDSGSPSLSSTATVYMNILDVNDNAPVFDPSSYSISVWENATLDTSVLALAVTDIDAGENGRVVFSITSGDDDGDFRIDSDTGTLYVQRPLDCETIPLYFLEVQAIDQAPDVNKRLYGTALVRVLILDVNDNAPTFTSPSELTVSEGYPPNWVVGTVVATDADQGQNQYIEYSLDPAGQQLFSIDRQQGTLTVKVQLDRESVDQYVVGVTARDQGLPPLSSTMALTVHVGDFNDHAPVLQPREYAAEIAENIDLGTSILQLTATDEDIGLNALLRYTIQEGDDNADFWIDSHAGDLMVQQRLDRELKASYSMVVVVQDLGEPAYSDTATVTVTVTDVNDCVPTFVDSPYVQKVQENNANIPVHVVEVSAHDSDSPPNAQLIYSLLSEDEGAEIFRINATTGIITAHAVLDRETKDQYILQVTAYDSGSPRLTGSGTVTVLVEDDNDNAPVFLYEHYRAEVAEEATPGTSVVQVDATDADHDKNARIKYSLEASPQFAVHADTGVVTTSVPLDREIQDIYTLVVVATDQGTIARSSSVSVMVRVLDINDQYPTFSQPDYEVYIRDPTPKDAFVAGVLATDGDYGDNGDLVYSLLPVGSSSLLIDSTTGVITAGVQLTSANAPTGYSFNVRATDKGQNPHLVEVPVVVHFYSASETNFPSITGPADTVISLSEDYATTTPVTMVTAVTSKPGATLSFHVIGGNTKDTFMVDSGTGEVRLFRALDHEAVPSYSIWIETRDYSNPPLTDSIKLQISVVDINDNVPMFDQLYYNVSVREESGSVSDFIRVTATDPDSGENGRVVYNIVSGNQDNAFSIDSDSGFISTTKSLDRETTDFYQLVVSAADNGIPSTSATATVDVAVSDINDNRAVFSGLFSVSIPEQVPTGYSVIKITSTDADIFPNNVHSYSLENYNQEFAIDSGSGEVTVIGVLDREIKNSYTITVKASDGLTEPSTYLTVDLSDINDNAPGFDHGSYKFSLVEGLPEGSHVGVVHATDRDDPSSANSALYYRLKDSSQYFKVDSGTGEITSRTSFTYKQVEYAGVQRSENTYQVLVLAVDQGDTPLQSETVVYVDILPANLHAPVFGDDDYVALAAEDTVTGHALLQIQATDADFNLNADIEYFITGGDGAQFVSLNKSTGWLSLASSVSGHANKDFIIMVEARDKGTPFKVTEAEVTLRVTEINYFSPVFASDVIFTVTVPEDVDVNTILATMSATDGDTGNNGLVSYFITGGDPSDQFSVDESGGYVRVKQPLDYEVVQAHYLNMTARDRGLLPREMTQLFTVLLTDINDNQPVFDQELYYGEVEENSPSGTMVLNLNATDVDTGGNAVIAYALTGSNKFVIDESTGVIRSQGSIDFEQEDLYSMSVQASNFNPSTSLSSSTMIQISVQGVNEYTPQFTTDEYEFVVSESSTPGSYVGSVSATDGDRGDGSVPYFYLIGDSNMKGFAINSSGDLTVSNGVDRESTAEVLLDVMVKNSGPIHGNDTSEAVIRIIVRDANDPPQFSQSLYEESAAEDTAVGSSVAQVTAIDNDILPLDRLFTYSILDGNDDGIFEIGINDGWLRTLKNLNRETLAVHTVIVAAVDMGTPSKTGSATVQLTITDINDNGPYFSPEIPMGYILEEQDPYSIAAINLSNYTEDPDLDPNRGPYSYTLLDHLSIFDITPGTSQVKVKVRLDRESVPEYRVKVKVTDSGEPTQTSMLTFDVMVQDINDNPSTPRPLTVVVYTFDGTFTGGQIADVRPLDPDTSGAYSCALTGGDITYFSIPHACELHAGLIQNMRVYDLEVQGSDGIHASQTYNVGLQFQEFDDETIARSVVVELAGTSVSQFLSDSYSPFLQQLEIVFSDADSVVLYAMEEIVDTESVNLFVAVSNGTGYFSTSLVTQRIKDNKAQIEAAAGVDISSVNQDPCSGSIQQCENGGECSSEIVRYETPQIQDSSYMVFTSPLVRQEWTCTCPEGFEGERCDVPVNECEGIEPCDNGGTCVSQGPGQYVCVCGPAWTGDHCQQDVNECQVAAPCQNGGSCHNTGGSYVCVCPAEYTGRHCELSTDPCAPAPCQHGGSCVADVEGGTYSCVCGFGERGERCEVSGRGFQSLSYEEYRLQLQPDLNQLVVEFSTVATDALLVYYPTADSDFLALEVVGGSVRFSYQLGAEPVTRVTVARHVSDGPWYRAEANRNGKVGTLQVTECSEGQAECEPCTHKQAECYAEASGQTYEILDAGSEDVLYVGGVEDISVLLGDSGRVSTHDFVGCQRAVWMDGVALEGLSPLDSVGVLDACERSPEGVCMMDGELQCHNGAICTDEWYDFRCTCSSDYTGDTCQQEVESYSFGGGAVVTYQQKESYRRDEMMGQQARRRKRSTGSHLISTTLQTSSKEGAVFYSRGSTAYMQIYVMDGRVRYNSLVEGGFSDSSLTVEIDVADSELHNITLHTTETSITLTVDGTSESASYTGPVYDPLGLDMVALTLGGIPQQLMYPGAFDEAFEGCVDKLIIDGEEMPLDGTTEQFHINVTGDLGFECAFGQSGPPIVAIIVVIVFFVIVLIVILIVFIILRKRRRDAKKSGTDTKLNGCLAKSNSSELDKGSTEIPIGQDSGFGENPDMSEEAIIRQHVTEEMKRTRDTRPDLVAPDVAVLGLRQGDVIVEANGVFNEGYTEEPPEHYDIDNASSIAPSDMVDIVSHYRRFRSGQLNEYHQQPRSNGPTYRPDPYRPPSNPHHTSSPGSLLDRSHDSLTTVSRQSPISMSSQPSRSPAVGPHINNLNRRSPLDVPGVQGTTTNIPTASQRSTPLSGISGLYPHSTSSMYSDRPTPIPNGHVASRPNSRVRQPITQVGLRGTPSKGLTVDDIHRLNTHSAASPSLDALSSSSDEEPLRNKINHTDFTHADLVDPSSQLPDDSSSEESANDSFTCSEFEFDNDRLRNDFSNPHRLVPRQPRAEPPVTHRNNGSHMSDSNRDDSFSTFFTSEDELSMSGKPGSKKLPPNALNLDYLLNWGPNFEKLVGVFSDIAQLPDADSRNQTPSSRPSSRGSPKPTSPFPKAPTPASPMPVIIEDSHQYDTHNGYDSTEAIFDNRVAEEYV